MAKKEIPVNTPTLKPALALLAVVAGLAGLGTPARAQFLVDDPFDMLSSTWTLQRGSASIADGWIRLQGNGYPRDAFVVTGVGGPWTDYRLVTRFHSDGGGDNWYNALINFRMKEFFGWSDGTWYGFYLYPPNSAIDPSGGFFLVKKTAAGYSHLAADYYDPSSLAIGDNLVDIEVRGGDIQLRLNGQIAASYRDNDPIPDGGVGLGAIWESVTRYDFAKVIEPYALEPSSETQVPRKAGAAFPVRFRIVDAGGANRSASTTPITVVGLRNAAGDLVSAKAPGGGPATCAYADGAYRCILGTGGLAPGEWGLEVRVNGDPRTAVVPFTLR